MTIDDFLHRCDAYRDRRAISLARLSTLIFNDGKKLGLMAAGGDIGVRTLERAVETLERLEEGQADAA